MPAVIIQARMSSQRLPGKVLKPLAGTPMLEFLIDRVRLCPEVSEIVVATTTNPADDVIAELAALHSVLCFRGSENDVLDRYAQAALLVSSANIVRVTADCPFIDPTLLSEIISKFNEGSFDYLSNAVPASFPDGLDLEIFSKQILLKANAQCTDSFMREHVTPWIHSSSDAKIGVVSCDSDLSSIRWTVDESDDYTVASNIADYFHPSRDFGWKDILNLYYSHPGLFAMNSSIRRNEGALLCDGQKLWKRAKKVIPGGNMLLSKRPDMFLPQYWPSYFSRAKGCSVWDLSNHKYIDMSIMGIGTNILGYGHDEVDSAVSDVVEKGNMSTLNCPEEVLLAERLVGLHPWSDMARFARSGGEANAIAVRIARAATGRDTVAICGYHGWHDWYLATNLANNTGLEEHLLPGLEPLGVPQSLSGTVIPFSYNRIDQLRKIVETNSLAAVKMEVQRSEPPAPGFLEEVRAICDANGIVLIFDECTSGFRETFGGLHLKYGVNPDMAMFGKALGNGYAITAVIGRRSVMDSAQNTFISSTFWTERIGPTAALKALEVMEGMKSWELISSLGSSLKNEWDNLASVHSINILQSGISAIAGFMVDSDSSLKYKTLISQEMLKKVFLASNLVFSSIAHTSEIHSEYLDALDKVFSLIAQCENGSALIDDLLDGPVCHSGFSRLN